MLLAGAAAGQIFECVDAKGNREFAQICPPGTVKETRLMNSGAGASKFTTSPAPVSKSLAEREAEFRKRALERQEAEAKAEKQVAESKEAERNCYDARSRLRELQDGYPIPRTGPNTGARTFLENKDRPAEIANAQKTTDNWCNKK